MSATSAWFVQIFDVAFSRRMCCSRVERVRTKPRKPCAVDGLADKPSGHLAKELFFGCDDATVGSAIAESHAKRLCFHADDIGLDGRTNYAERNCFSNRDDKQRAFGVCDGRDGGNVFNRAEEVRDSARGRLQSSSVTAASSAARSTRPVSLS